MTGEASKVVAPLGADRRPRICVVTAGGPYAWIIVNALGSAFGGVDVIVEQPEQRLAFLRRRARKIGWSKTASQFATMILVRVGKKLFSDRIERINREYGVSAVLDAMHRVTPIDSINSPQFLAAVSELKPDVMLLTGCRLMGKATLERLAMPVLNCHPGITPRYRGMNGGYWALANDDPDNFGATVHLVDPGIDTGAVICQVRGEPAPDDNLMTYTHRLAALSTRICIDAVRGAWEGTLRPIPVEGPSHQWYHPTLFEYLRTGLTRGIW